VLTVEGQHASKLIGDRWESWNPTSQAIFWRRRRAKATRPPAANRWLY